MDSQQHKFASESEFFSPAQSPFPVSLGSSSSEKECKDNEMGFPLELQQQSEESQSQGSKGEQGSDEDDKNARGDEEEGESGHKKLSARGHWRPSEDAKLREFVAQNGPQNWNLIAEQLEGRSGKSCRLRWYNQLDPRINRKAFSEEEEERLLAAHSFYGNKWAQISRLFPGRTDNAVKNHWHVIMARMKREQSSTYKRRKPPFRCSSHSPPQMMEMSSSSSIASKWESTSIRDESPSACTDLSLSSSTSMAFPRFFSRLSLSQQQQPFLEGSEEKPTAVRNVSVERFLDYGSGFHNASPLVLAMGGDQSGYSDSTSEVSATESVANQRPIASPHHEADDEKEMPFIDFLGTGVK